MKDKQSQPVAIQEARQTDAGEILAVQKSAFTEEMKAYGFYDIPPLTETVDDVREAMRAGVMLKAVLEGRIVGAVRASSQDGSCLVGRLAVTPDLWNKGIGRSLMEEIESRCPDACRLELFVGSKSDKNIRLYEKLGYRTFKSEPVGEDVELLYMEKRLGCDP